MFVGFTDGVKGFKMWHPTEKGFVITRDVTFKEREMFMLKENLIVEVYKALTTRIDVKNPKDPPTETSL